MDGRLTATITTNFDEDGNIKRDEDGKIKWSHTGIGSAISAEGTLEMENVTFTDGNGTWLRVEGTATLKNLLFEDNWVSNYGSGGTVKGVLYVTKTGSATLNNAVFRDTARVVVAIEKGGSLSTTGCLSFVRVWTHKVHHSGIFQGHWGPGAIAKPSPAPAARLSATRAKPWSLTPRQRCPAACPPAAPLRGRLSTRSPNPASA